MFKHLVIYSTLAIALTLAIPTSASAQQVCGPRENMVKTLKKQYKEEQIGLGLKADGTVIELWMSATGTWTIAITQSNGKSCIGASGTKWQMFFPSFNGFIGKWSEEGR